MKKLLVFMLCAVMLACPAFAEAGEFGFDGYDFAVNSYSGSGSEVTVPDYIDGCPVTIIDNSVFYCNSEITVLSLPETLQTIESSNIYYMEALEQVNLPESLEIIDEYNFYCCPLVTEVVIPSRVTYIGSYSFYSCDNLRSVTFTGDVPAMGYSCFEYLPADAVVYVPDDRLGAYQAALPEGVIIAASGANAVTWDYTADEALFDFDPQTGTINEYLGIATRVDIPSEIGGVPVTAIGMNAFRGHRYLYYVTVPEGVTRIDEYAFGETYHLCYVDLPASLGEICEGAFYFFHGPYIELPEGVYSVGKEAFCYSQLEEAYFPEGIGYIGERAFADSNVNYLCFAGDILPYIEANAFEDSYVADVDLSWQCSKDNMQAAQALFDGLGQEARVWRMQNPNVEYISDGQDVYENGVLVAYSGTQSHLRPWDSFDGVDVTGVGPGAFADNPYIIYFSVPYNDVFTTIGDGAFAGSGVEYVDLFDSVTYIGERAFENCRGLTTITIPESVTYIGEGAFRDCVSLTSVVVLCDPAVLPADAFEGCISLNAVYASPEATDEQVMQLTAAAGRPWHSPAIRLGEEPREIERMPYEELPSADFWCDAEYARIDDYFGGELNLYLPREVDGVAMQLVSGNIMNRSHGDENFPAELPVRSVVIPENYTEIADYAFYGCDTLEVVVCYAPIEYIGEGVFGCCPNLREVIFVNGVGTVNEYAFMGSEALETVYVGDLCTLPVGFFDEMGGDGFDVNRVITDPALLPDVDSCLMAVKSDPIEVENYDIDPGYEEEEFVFLPVGEEGAAFFGAWQATEVNIAGEIFPAADFGMLMELQFNEDGSVVNYDVEMEYADLAPWCVIDGYAYVADTALYVDEQGMLVMADDDVAICFEAIDALSCDPSIIPTIADVVGAVDSYESEPAAETAAAAGFDAADPASRMDVKFICTSYIAGGSEWDAAQLGAEYSLCFHEDGSVDFVLADMALAPASWGLEQVSIGLTQADAFVINYYGTEYNAVLTETGFELDYYGLIYVYEPMQ